MSSRFWAANYGTLVLPNRQLYLILWGVSIPDNHMGYIGPQIRLVDRSHLLCLIYDRRLRDQYSIDGIYPLFMIDARAA